MPVNASLKIVSLIALVVIASCAGKPKNESDFDKAVMQEIFPALLDSMYVEVNWSSLPPQVIVLTDSVTGKKNFKEVVKESEIRELLRKRLELLDSKSQFVPIVIIRNIHELSEYEMNEFRTKYSVSNDTAITSYLKTSYLFSLDQPGVRKCFKLMSSSDHKSDREEWSGIKELSFSRIIFDVSKTHGMLECAHFRGPMDANGYRIFIKKVNGKWVIDEIEHAWIS